MKFTIEIEEFWSEEEGSIELAQELKRSIISEVTNKIKSEISQQVATQIELKVRETLASELNSTIQTAVDKFVREGTVKGSCNSDPRVTFVEALQNSFESLDVVTKMDAKLKKTVDEQVEILIEEFKERYDTSFATQIVMKLNEGKFLKDGIVDLLIKK
jgi:hypothetical protein